MHQSHNQNHTNNRMIYVLGKLCVEQHGCHCMSGGLSIHRIFMSLIECETNVHRIMLLQLLGFPK